MKTLLSLLTLLLFVASLAYLFPGANAPVLEHTQESTIEVTSEGTTSETSEPKHEEREQPIEEEPAPAPEETSVPTPASQESEADAEAKLEAEILRFSNIEREKAGLNTLSRDVTLRATAHAHSADMLERDYFSHDTPEGCSSSCRATSAGYEWRMIGENIFMISGWKLTTTEAAIMIVNGWLGSPGHRENLLKNGYTESGIGVAIQGDTIYATALYGTPR